MFALLLQEQANIVRGGLRQAFDEFGPRISTRFFSIPRKPYFEKITKFTDSYIRFGPWRIHTLPPTFDSGKIKITTRSLPNFFFRIE